MNFLIFSALMNAFVAGLLGFVVIIKNSKELINRLFFALSISIIFWSLNYWQWLAADNADAALFFTRLLTIVSIFIPIFYFHWILSFIELDQQKKSLIRATYLLGFILLLFSFSKLIIQGVTPKLFFPFWPIPGLLYAIYLIFIYIGLTGYALFILFREYKLSSGIRKKNIKYLIIGSLFGILGGITNFFLWYDIPIPPYGNFLVSFYPIVLFIAAFRFHLFNIKVIATELLTFSIWIAVLFELLIADTWKERLFEGALFIFVIVAGTSLIRSVLKEVHQREEIEKLNSQLSVRTQQLTSLKDFTTSLIKTLDFKEIIQIIVNGIVERFNYPGVFLTGLTDDGKYLYPLAISQNKPVELALKLLPKKLDEYKEEIANNPSLAAQAIQTNSIQISEDFGKFFSVVPALLLRGMQSLIGFKTILAIPVISKDKVMGVLNVAMLKAEKEIGIAELELLNTIANQIGIIMTNAKLFQQIEQANEKLIEMDKMKAGMYSFVSHQIKAPIGIVKGFAQLLSDGSYGKLPKKAKERVEDMKKSCDRLIQLVNDFLDLRRIEEGRMEYEFADVDIVKLVKSVFEELKLLASQKKLEFSFDCAEKEIKIKADEQRLRQVIQNLIENAIKYTERGFVKATIDYDHDNNSALIKVEDSGMGIKPDVLPQLFDQFKRAKEARLIQGTGLGLYIAREIVKAHGGEIWAESEGGGNGSRFYVKLSEAKV